MDPPPPEPPPHVEDDDDPSHVLEEVDNDLFYEALSVEANDNDSEYSDGHYSA